MRTVQGFCVLLLLHLSFFDSGRTGKILVWPLDFSHWINIKVILDQLQLRGHEITVLVTSPSYLFDHTKIPFNVEILQLPVTQETLIEELNRFLYEASFEMPKLSWWSMQVKLTEFIYKFSQTAKRICDSTITNKELLSRLQAAKFDICLADPLNFGGELLAELLNIPFIYSFRFSYGNVIERLCAQLPVPSSYVPVSTSGLTDRMTFAQRLENWLLNVISNTMFSYLLFPEWDDYYSKALDSAYNRYQIAFAFANEECAQEYANLTLEKMRTEIAMPISYPLSRPKQQKAKLRKGKPTTLCETMGKAEMWLIRTYWDLEFPYPYLPNFEFVGGLHCKPAKPLPKELEEFVQSSGKDGVVVFTLGSMVNNLTEEKSNLIASALAQIPQKVLWRYTGKKPVTLGPNTRLYEWIPQNDLLGHPKTRAFITHCGTNGIYEAIYHGVPIVGIPLFADQPDNVARIKSKGAAVKVDFTTMTSSDLLNALKAVINNPSYKENAMRLSRIHHDQPTKPLDRAVFWIEFVMRHKGAKHLRPAAHNLTWVQYHSLDVIGFLLACVATTLFLVTKCCLFCCRKFGKTRKKNKRD